MTAEDDALGFVAAMHEESTRQLAQLRVTIQERYWAAADRGEMSKAFAYADVLCLLGPEPAWSTDNTGEPF